MRSFNLLAGLTMLLALPCNGQTPSLPSQDTFYKQPANISSYRPGDVIKHRSISTEIRSNNNIPYTVKSATQFFYRTTDSLGTSVGAVMTFLVPNGSNANSSRLLVYSAAYDAARLDCAPSYTIQKGASNNAGTDFSAIKDALDNGWYVVTSDYEGLKSQFVAGLQSGHGVLDSIRASFNRTVLSATGLNPKAVYGMFGYSGGSLASEWAAELAPNYAPDLNRFVGTAIGGLTPNVTNVLLLVSGQIPATLAFGGTLGLSNAYSNLSNYLLKEQLIVSKSDEYYRYANSCQSDSNPIPGAGKNFFSFFTAGTGILQSDVYKTVISGAGQQGVHGIPKQPMYIYKGTMDEVSPICDTDQLVHKYCKAGVTIQYLRRAGAGHISEASMDTPLAYSWLSDRFAGKPIKQNNNLNNCEIMTISIIGVTQPDGLQTCSCAAGPDKPCT